MGDLTTNISRSELACGCGCGFDTVDWETIEIVQGVCDAVADLQGVDKVVLDITSAARCLEYNRSIGSTDASQHVKGRAIDFVIRGFDPENAYAALDNTFPDSYGLGIYPSFTHVDSRSDKKARW